MPKTKPSFYMIQAIL